MKFIILSFALVSSPLFAQKEKYANAGAITFSVKYTTGTDTNVTVVAPSNGVIYTGPIVSVDKLDISHLPKATFDICASRFATLTEQVTNKSGKDYDFVSNACKKSYGSKFVGISKVTQQKCMPVNLRNPKEYLLVPAVYCLVND